jgi:hypothetical protein
MLAPAKPKARSSLSSGLAVRFAAAAHATENGPTITAKLADGPMKGTSTQVAVVEGRPPKIIDLAAADESMLRYCLAEWVQAGPSAVYTFLYRV